MSLKYRRLFFLGPKKNNSRPLPSDLPHTLQAIAAAGGEPLVEDSVIAGIGAGAAVFAGSNIPVLAADEVADIDLGVVLGGDGAFLGAARRYAPRGITLVGINLGFLGFLTDIARDDMQQSLLGILAGECDTETRFMLSVRFNGELLAEDLSVAINDVVISRGGAGTLLRLRVHINDTFVYNLRADGLILSTPSGSTAYALSAGGPIVAPDLDANLLVPLCPHALTHRPLVVRADYPIRVQVVEAQSATAHIDGQGDQPLAAGDVIEVCRHSVPLKICHPLYYDYYQTLRKKFLWGE